MHAICVPFLNSYPTVNFIMSWCLIAMHLSEQVSIGGKSMLAKDEVGQPMLTLLTPHKTINTTYTKMSSLSRIWVSDSVSENTLWNLWLYTSVTTICKVQCPYDLFNFITYRAKLLTSVRKQIADISLQKVLNKKNLQLDILPIFSIITK